MAGRNRQGKQKSRRRSADLAIRPPEDVGYVGPPPEECEELAFSFDPGGGNMTEDRIKVRMVEHVPTSGVAEFAVIQETKFKGNWRKVAEADSAHDDEVHVHRYGRRADGRIGEPEHLTPISRMDDVAEGYDLAYGVIVWEWEANKRRWADG